jgi:hypothetical protein
MKKKEKLGVGLSMACAIHCMSMPFLVTLFPILGAEWFNETIEIILVGGSILLALWILGNDFFKHHKSYEPLSWAMIGFLIIISGHFIQNFEIWTAFIGGVFLVIAYWRNIKIKHKVKVCEC